MKRAFPVILVLLLMGTVVLADEGQLQVPGKRMVVIHPGDVVVQAADLTRVARFRFDVNASGEVTVTGEAPREARGLGAVGMAEVVNSYVSSVTGTCYESYPGTPCSGTGHPSPRYLFVAGSYYKPFAGGMDNPCSWILSSVLSPATGWSNSANVSGVSVVGRYFTVDCGGGLPCWVGDPVAVPFGMLFRVDLSTISNFTVWVDFLGSYATPLCPVH